MCPNSASREEPEKTYVQDIEAEIEVRKREEMLS
jgi:hypothetical protein